MARITTRKDLARYFNQLGFNVGAEIGVAEGNYSIQLCDANPLLKLYAIDSWGLEDPISHHLRIDAYQTAQQKLSPYNITLIRKFSMDALKDFEDSSLDFVYIDANHRFDYVVYDIIEWTKKVKKGGIVSGHDYVVANQCGVIPAVNAYVQAHTLKLNVTTDPTETISWWFVKRWNT